MRRNPLFCAVILTVLSACSSRAPAPVRVGREVLVTRREIRNELAARKMSLKTAPLAVRQSILSNAAQRVLFIRDAREKGVAEYDGIRKVLEERLRRYVIQSVLQRVSAGSRQRYLRSELKKTHSVLEIRLIWIHAPWSLDASLRSSGAARLRDCQRALRGVKSEEAFAAVADRFSDDPSNLKGGFLGVFSEEEMNPSFRPFVTRMKSGEIAPLIGDEDGFTILRLDSVTTDSSNRRKRYGLSVIFFSSPEGEREQVRAIAVTVLEELKRDPSRFKDLANRYSKERSNKGGGLMRPFVFERMHPAIAEAAWQAGEGGIAGPIGTPFGYFFVRTGKIRPPSVEAMRRIRKDPAQYRAVRERIADRKAAAVREEKNEVLRRRLSRRASLVRDYSCFTNAALTNRVLADAAVILKMRDNNVSFFYSGFLDAFGKRFGPGSAFRRSYAEKVSFFETTLLFPELVHAEGLRRGVLTRKSGRRKMRQIEDDLLYQYYLRDLASDIQPDDALLKEWVRDEAPEPFRSRPFGQVREQARTAWLTRRREERVRARFQELAAPRQVRISDEGLLTPRERRMREEKVQAERILRRGNTNEAVKLLADAFRRDPLWTDALRLVGLSDSLGEKERENVYALLRRVVPKMTESPEPLLDDPALRSGYFRLMRELPDRSGIPLLAGRLTEPDLILREEYIRLLADLNAVSAVQSVLEAVRGERSSPTAESFLVRALPELGRLADASVHQVLAGWLKEEKRPSVQAALIRSLSGSREEPIPALLRSYERSPWPIVREAVQEGFAR